MEGGSSGRGDKGGTEMGTGGNMSSAHPLPPEVEVVGMDRGTPGLRLGFDEP